MSSKLFQKMKFTCQNETDLFLPESYNLKENVRNNRKSQTNM